MIHERHLPVSRTARYHVLGESERPPREVWIVCHGYGQLAAPFLKRFEALDDGSRLLVAPEALSRFYLEMVHTSDSRVGASWMTREDREAEMKDYIAYLDGLESEVFARLGRDGVRLVVVGFSQGTATASRWAVRGAARVDRLILWAGLLPPDVAPAAEREKLNGLDLVLVAGDKDDYVTPARLAEQRSALHCQLERSHPFAIVERGGHEQL